MRNLPTQVAGGITVVASVAALPTGVAEGSLRYVADTDKLYQYSGSAWTVVGDTSGYVVGPATSTDNAIVRFDGTTGELVQNSVVTLSDAGAFQGLASINGTTATQISYLDATSSIQTQFNTNNLATVAAGSYPLTLTSESSRVQVLNPAGAGDVNLPSTGVATGTTFRIVNRASNVALTIKSSDGDTVLGNFYNGYAVVTALQATPTDATHWHVQDYSYELDYTVSSISWTISGGGSAPSSTLLQRHKAFVRNGWVNLSGALRYSVASTNVATRVSFSIDAAYSFLNPSTILTDWQSYVNGSGGFSNSGGNQPGGTATSFIYSSGAIFVDDSVNSTRYASYQLSYRLGT